MTGTASTVATAPAIARVFAEFVWEANSDGAGAAAGDGTRSRNTRGSRSGGYVAPAPAAASATATWAVTTAATALATAAVSVLQTIHGFCWLAVAVRGGPSLYVALLLRGFGVPRGSARAPPPRFAREAEQGTARAAGTDAGADAGEGGAVPTCDCGRHCVRGRDCHRDCDCDDDRCCAPLLCPLTDVAGGLPHSAGRNTVQFRT